MKSLSKIIILLSVLTVNLFAQGGALPFTLIQQSPILLGAGQTGVALPNNEVLGFYYNPAMLGYTAKENHVAFSIMPSKTSWSSYFRNDDFTFNNYGFNLGYTFSDTKLNLPVSIGIGFIHNKFNYGKFNNTQGNYYDSFNAFSLGIGTNYYLDFYFGITLKTFNSQVPVSTPKGNDDMFYKTYTADGTLMDYGAFVTFPISKIYLQKKNLCLSETAMLKPVINFSLGYAMSNYGDDFYYKESHEQTTPFSRTARIGYTLEIGSKLVIDNFSLNIFDYSFSAEASDLLIKQDTYVLYADDLERNTENSQYQSGLLGDISFPDHLITLKSDDKVTVHKGHIFTFFETFIYTTGRFSGGGYTSSRHTSGIGFTSKGIFKLLSSQIQQPALNYIFNHFEIKYFNSGVNFFANRRTVFEGLTINFKGFRI